MEENIQMKKLIACITIALSMIMSIDSVIFAAEFIPSEFTSITVESNILPAEIQDSVDYIRIPRRGVFFSSADLKIANYDGDIGVSGHVYMLEPVDEIYMTIYLDKYIVDEDGEGRWVYVDMFEFEFYAEDYPDGELTSESVEFTLTGYPTGEYYRLRGSYAAVKDGLLEGFGPVTDGILIQ